MFTGIIETTGRIVTVQPDGSNIHFTVESAISNDLKIDQSVSHDGVCLTVVKTGSGVHLVTAVAETLSRSNLKQKKVGDELNMEQSLRVGDRLDGHLVQGHVDAVAVCKKIKSKNGSWVFTFRIGRDSDYLFVDKGSVAVNGVSLTIIKPAGRKFSVAIIPYTYAHTNFKNLKEGDEVNIEFDIIGKYVHQILTGKTVQ